eukprot:6195779-Pleurochrysis_carterae.AAC.4
MAQAERSGRVTTSVDSQLPRSARCAPQFQQAQRAACAPARGRSSCRARRSRGVRVEAVCGARRSGQERRRLASPSGEGTRASEGGRALDAA